jgi:regulator-associated protein of mTOR
VFVLGSHKCSLAGDVRLWDLRGSDAAAQTWDLHHAGLSVFDGHSQTGVFAT